MIRAREEAIANLSLALGTPLGTVTYLWFGGWWGVLIFSLFGFAYGIGRYIWFRIKNPVQHDPLALLEELVDPDPCWFDHHGYCQAHSLHMKPCPHERAKELLDATRHST